MEKGEHKTNILKCSPGRFGSCGVRTSALKLIGGLPSIKRAMSVAKSGVVDDIFTVQSLMGVLKSATGTGRPIEHSREHFGVWQSALFWYPCGTQPKILNF